MPFYKKSHWNLQEDEFLAKYFDAVGDMVGPHDLNRAPGSATKRVAKLKETGAWEILLKRFSDDYAALHAYYSAVGTERDLEILEMMHPGAPEENQKQELAIKFGVFQVEKDEGKAMQERRHDLALPSQAIYIKAHVNGQNGQ